MKRRHQTSRITVVVPAYNQGPYIRETILSLQNQILAPAEIIVSNNHSTDETRDVLTSLNDSRIRIISPPTHLDACSHANFLMGQVRTEWAALLSSDDVAKENYVSGFEEAIAATSQPAVLVRGGIDVIDGDGQYMRSQRLLSVRRCETGSQAFLGQLRGPKAFFAAICLNMRAFAAVGGFKYYAEMGDWPLYLELCRLGAFLYTGQIQSKYRFSYRPGLLRKRLPGELADEWKIHREVIPGVAQSLGIDLRRRGTRAAKSRLLYRIRQIRSESMRFAELGDPRNLEEWARHCGIADIRGAIDEGNIPFSLEAWAQEARSAFAMKIHQLMSIAKKPR